MRRLGMLVAGALAATVAPPVLAAPHARCEAPLACGADRGWAIEMESLIADNLVDGQVVEISYATPERVPGDVQNVGAWGDSGLWTGTYLAAESFRYATATAKLDGGRLSPDEQQFWSRQRDEALPRIERMVDKYHLLVNIAEGWHTETEIQQNPSEVSPIGFGGGVVDGQAGMLMRACAPVDSPATHDMEPNKRVFGPFPWEGIDYWCETAPSRDTYAGTTFGLLAAYDLVGDDLGARRDQIRGDVLALADFLVRHGWTYPRPHGNVSVPGVQGGHDFDNFISPLFTYVPLARLNMAQVARHVATGTDQQAKWDAVWAEELATQLPLLALSMEVDAADPYAGYYKFNLHHLTGHTLIRLERDPALRALFLHALGVMDNTTGDDVNAHFEAITYAITGEASRLAAAVTHLREWRDYRERIDLGGDTFNESGCGVDFECVRNDQREIDGIVVPGTAGLRARFPLPVADRPPTDFLWQRPPTQLNGSTSATHQAPGVDYLLPYWLLRYHTEVAVPALTPFPAWPGPAHG